MGKYGPVLWTIVARSYPARAPGRARAGSLGLPGRAPLKYRSKLIPWADPGPAQAGPSWESTGLALARTNPMVPRVAQPNPAWDQTGLAIWAVGDLQEFNLLLDPSHTENLSYPILPMVSCNCNIIIRYLASYQ